MQCSRCGASVRPGMTECPACGAPLAASSGGASGSRGADRYIPGGGAPQQPASNQQPDQPQQQQARPLGSLQRRLQASQASIPQDDDDEDDDWFDTPPPRAGRSRGSDVQGYGERSRRSQPVNGPTGGPSRRPSQGSGAHSRGGEQRRGGYDGYDESREDQAYSPYPPYRREYDESREQPAWDDSREAPAPRRSGGPDRYRADRVDRRDREEREDREDRMDASVEMSAEGPAYGGPAPRSSPRSTPRRRSRPMDGPRGENDYTNPLDDPRSPLRGAHGSAQGRRPSQGSSGRGARSSGAGGYRQGGYTEAEMRAQGYQDDGRYRDYPDYPDYPNDRDDRDYADYRSGYSEEAPAARGGSRGRGGYPAPYDRDDYASREQWAAPGADRDAGYSYYGEAYGGGFEESAQLWQPVGGAGRAGAAGAQGRSRGSAGGARAATKKRRGGALRMVFGLLLLVALVAALGIKFGPKVYDKYIAHTAGGGGGPTQASITCASQATPSAQIKPATGFTAFATTAYALTYPTGWQTTSQSGASQNQCDVVFLFTQPNGGAARFYVEEAGAFTPLSDIQIIQAEAQAAQQQGSAFVEITSAATTQQVGGEVWQRREYQVTPKSGVKLHVALLATHHKGAGFAIVMMSSDTGFASDDTTTFEKMLTSFQFA